MGHSVGGNTVTREQRLKILDALRAVLMEVDKSIAVDIAYAHHKTWVSPQEFEGIVIARLNEKI